jgi:hypothetical protein
MCVGVPSYLIPFPLCDGWLLEKANFDKIT